MLNFHGKILEHKLNFLQYELWMDVIDRVKRGEKDRPYQGRKLVLISDLRGFRFPTSVIIEIVKSNHRAKNFQSILK